ncbi:MAG: M24 family metallopeptidase [Spirochaetaceae bacterium]|jgi:Xaa-Pro aminopeptidase|nr:M24 family metallopeptidase [Spirochaetaceae bacterium]
MAHTDFMFTADELRKRRSRLCAAMDARYPDWDTALLIDPVHQYYLTGTMQDGIILIRRDGSGGRLFYAVRRSFERALLESPLFGGSSGSGGSGAANETIIPIASYRELAEAAGAELGRAYIEGDTMTAAVWERLTKYFTCTSPEGSRNAAGFLDRGIRGVRSVKSDAEIELVRRSGAAHRILFEEQIPGLLREGMSEADVLGDISAAMYRLGYQGITRFHQLHAGMALGQIGFGENALYPSMFDGPGGGMGACPAAPLSASSGRRLAKGDAVFVDIGFGVGGYHTDKTQVYFFGASAPPELERAQAFCIELQRRIAALLRPGAIPSQIYRDIMDSLPQAARAGFMGVDDRHRVKFLGHGVGLDIDELPVIAHGFNDPLENNMVLAIEPKKAVTGISLAGVEDTYIVTPAGGLCVTGGGRGIICV